MVHANKQSPIHGMQAVHETRPSPVHRKTSVHGTSSWYPKGSSVAVYKQWIPNTNFENAANWNQNRIPCAKDTVLFGSSKIVSVFVQASHSLTDMYLPLNGEFIMAPAAGFAAFDGNYNPGCETASEITFKSTDNYEWYDPTLWHAAASLENLDLGKYIFLVDEERVPCQYDDVIFQPETSFQVNITSKPTIQIKSISIMGQNFTNDSSLAEYMQSSSAKLQFHGQGTLRLSHTRCPDKSGCECGNSATHERICAALLQNSRNQCPMVTCKDAIKPTGHCCEICGVIITLTYAADFDIELYRDRIFHTFLNLPRNKGVQMAISKMKKLQTPLRIVPRGLDSIIQIVLIDNKTGHYAGTHAEQLANDILKDIADHGKFFGIVTANLQVATGSNWSAQGIRNHLGPTITGIVIGILLVLFFLGIILLLYKNDALRSVSSLNLSSLWKQKRGQEGFGGTIVEGFDNPMFDTPCNPSVLANRHSVEETQEEMANRNSRLYYINPLYDEIELNV
ncbi:protein amnionless [Ahaetulla prasina]|uniref:protein amnionless n=1 Tax=Ahaetulla prasina TaxID=499056 RepID=UPI0026484EDB|nr:protein amnionless [Ahaetulla prasina]